MSQSLPDVVILGAGVIGLSLALELHRRGYPVTLHDPRAAATQASWAAAGMLAAEDPHNPPALAPLSRLSATLYPAFLQQIAELSGESVPFQTAATVQHLGGGETMRLREHSLDPRQLALALITAVRRAGIPLLWPEQRTSTTRHRPATVVHALGAWASFGEIAPRKGQMLRVKLSDPTRLTEVHRSEEVYVVPRTTGPQAGTALIGATVENAGFDTAVVPEALDQLRQRGAALVPHVPEIADPRQTPLVEAWAGLRPATPDGLPLLGELPGVALPSPGDPAQRHFIASGHYRNGILLAPVTAVILADLISGRHPAVDLSPFAPSRFLLATVPEPAMASDIRIHCRDNPFPYS